MVKKFPPLDEGLNDLQIPEDQWRKLVELIPVDDRQWLTAIIASYIGEKRLRPPSVLTRYIDRIEGGCSTLISCLDPEAQEIPAEVFGAFIQSREFGNPDQEYRDCLDQIYKLRYWCKDAKKQLPPARTALEIRTEFLRSVNVFVSRQTGGALHYSANDTADRQFVNLLFKIAGNSLSEWEVSAAMSDAFPKRRSRKSAAKKSTPITVS